MAAVRYYITFWRMSRPYSIQKRPYTARLLQIMSMAAYQAYGGGVVGAEHPDGTRPRPHTPHKPDCKAKGAVLKPCLTRFTFDTADRLCYSHPERSLKRVGLL